eukprot:Platyproteum_vivax@DN1409_c0_g1_i1.p1
MILTFQERDRRILTVAEVLNCQEPAARTYLQATDWDVETAIQLGFSVNQTSYSSGPAEMQKFKLNKKQTGNIAPVSSNQNDGSNLRIGILRVQSMKTAKGPYRVAVECDGYTKRTDWHETPLDPDGRVICNGVVFKEDIEFSKYRDDTMLKITLLHYGWHSARKTEKAVGEAFIGLTQILKASQSSNHARFSDWLHLDHKSRLGGQILVDIELSRFSTSSTNNPPPKTTRITVPSETLAPSNTSSVPSVDLLDFGPEEPTKAVKSSPVILQTGGFTDPFYQLNDPFQDPFMQAGFDNTAQRLQNKIQRSEEEAINLTKTGQSSASDNYGDYNHPVGFPQVSPPSHSFVNLPNDPLRLSVEQASPNTSRMSAPDYPSQSQPSYVQPNVRVNQSLNPDAIAQRMRASSDVQATAGKITVQQTNDTNRAEMEAFLNRNKSQFGSGDVNLSNSNIYDNTSQYANVSGQMGQGRDFGQAKVLVQQTNDINRTQLNLQTDSGHYPSSLSAPLPPSPTSQLNVQQSGRISMTRSETKSPTFQTWNQEGLLAGLEEYFSSSETINYFAPPTGAVTTSTGELSLSPLQPDVTDENAELPEIGQWNWSEKSSFEFLPLDIYPNLNNNDTTNKS